MRQLLSKIQKCTFCKNLPLGPRPIVSFTEKSKVLIIWQAPGTKVHKTGIPWDDPSWERLRDWLGIRDEVFYNPDEIALMPMGFCYPGKWKSWDLPPRKECAPLWHEEIISQLPNIELIVLIGQYAQKYYLKDKLERNLTETVKSYKNYLPTYFVLPHPSPRNNIWMKKNDWFEKEVIPELQNHIKAIL